MPTTFYNGLLEKIKTGDIQNEVVILDGGLATELEAAGCELDSKLWSASLLVQNPQIISQVHTKYLEAGADIITTSSYQATIKGFTDMGLSLQRAQSLLQKSVELAKEARAQFIARESADPSEPKENGATEENGGGKDKRGTGLRGRLFTLLEGGADEEEEEEEVHRWRPLVAASVGSYGAYMADGSEYLGTYGRAKGAAFLAEWHARQLEELVQAGPDLLAFETVPCLEEVEAIVGLLNGVDPRVPLPPAWVSLACKDGSTLPSGALLGDAVRAIEKFDAHRRVVAVGVNCLGPALLEQAVATVRRHSTRVVLAYPNRGEGWDAVGHCWRGGEEAADDARLGEALAGAWRQGAKVLGGCCRTTPATVAELRRRARAGRLGGAGPPRFPPAGAAAAAATGAAAGAGGGLGAVAEEEGGGGGGGGQEARPAYLNELARRSHGELQELERLAREMEEAERYRRTLGGGGGGGAGMGCAEMGCDASCALS